MRCSGATDGLLDRGRGSRDGDQENEFNGAFGMTERWARWGGQRAARALLFVFVGLLAAGCSRFSSPPPETTPTAPAVGSIRESFAAIQEDAERHFAAGEQAYRSGRYSAADQQFQRALDVYLEAEVGPQDREAHQAAFNDLFNRIHALGLAELIPINDDLVSLDDEPLFSPSEAALADLRERLAVNPSEMPKFDMPVPSPLENERVEWALAYLSGERKEVIEEGLSRATVYMPMIFAIMDEVGVPRELGWSPLIESLYKTSAFSRAAAVGMWQFISGTARLYGMKVDYNLDERRDPVISTRTAAIYMRDLYEEYGDWSLVLAAYNAGKGRISRAMQRTGTTDFWRLAETRQIPRETRDHVPKIYAAILMGTDPELYGLNVVQRPPYVYEESVMDENTDLRVIADAAGVSDTVIRYLNPHIRGWVPKDYAVRIPPGSKSAFEEAIAAIPPAERIEFITHRVARGETLSEIAARYGTRINAIVEVNQLRSANRLSINQRLIIPVGPQTRPYRSQPVAGFDTGERTTYRVERGDSLYEIAQNFKTSVPNLMRWNDLNTNRIYPGDTLIVYFGVRGAIATPPAVTRTATTESFSAGNDAASPNSNRADRTIYTVRRGDSFYLIAQRFDVSVDALKSWNNRTGNTIHPGDKLVLYSAGLTFDDAETPGSANTTTRSYLVVRGDSPYEIAQRFDVSLDALLAANGLSRRSNIYPGDELLLPGGGSSTSRATYTVRRGDTLGRIAERHGISLRSLLQANGLSSRSIIHPGDRLAVPLR